jgi:hypothetical protein
MKIDPLAVEYERIREQLAQALSEGVRDMGAVSRAMDQLENVRMRFKARSPLQDANPEPVRRDDSDS